MLKKIGLLMALAVSLPSFAYNSEDTETDNIQYLKVVYKPIASGGTIPNGVQASAFGIPFTIDSVDLKPKDIKKIADIGKRFCNGISDADVTLSFVLDAGGEVAIVEASLQAGVEVTFHCAKHK